jgi:lipoprotein-anchoring transpeptidase ErfK/SrfK
MKKIGFVFLSVLAVLAILVAPVEARGKHRRHRAPALPPIVVVNVSIASQTMSVSVNGWPEGYWRISSAREGYHTPRGSYRVTRMAREYYSKKYDDAPMPNSVFFYGGYAIHATNQISRLGRPASHGCIRLHPSDSAELYDLVQEYGMSRTRININ